MLRYCDVFQWTILKRTSKEAHVYMRRHQGPHVRISLKTKADDVSKHAGRNVNCSRIITFKF